MESLLTYRRVETTRRLEWPYAMLVKLERVDNILRATSIDGPDVQ